MITVLLMTIMIIWGGIMIDITKLHKKPLAALLLAFLMSAMLPACSSSEEEEEQSNKDEICDEADAGSTGCPG
jgi:hypothetical protein